MDASDCDRYRGEYPGMSFESFREWHERLAEEHPGQSHFCLDAVMEFFMFVDGPSKVVELGGWDGELAGEVLRREESIESWTNYEIAPVNSAPRDARYSAPYMTEHFWDVELPKFNVFVASHVLEHLSEEHLDLTLDKVSGAEYLYMEIPVDQGKTNWNGTTCFHVLDLGWGDLERKIAMLGYKRFMLRCGKVDRQSVRCFQKEK